MHLKPKIIGSCILGVSILFSQTLFGHPIIFAAEKEGNYIEQTSSQKNNTLGYTDNSYLTKEYKDEQYSFTLKIPDSWINNVHVNRDQYDVMAKGTINFIVNIGEKEYPICSILIFDTNPEIIDYVESGLLKKLDETDKLIYTYIRASQRPVEYYEDKNFKKMYDSIYKEILNVMESCELLAT
ncbi:hypothetical protein ACQVQY_30915 [Bacillus mycoides]|uniref:hypothetical protein n=1 Tax=Bacillus mycoides TaxID=1405 RepID=UPI003D653D6E